MDALSYNEKLTLLATKCRNGGMINRLTIKENPGKVDYLLKKYGLLKKAIKPKPKPPAPKPKAKPQKKEPEKLKVVRHGQQINFDDLPPGLQKLWEQNRDNYKLIRSLHEKLKLMANLPETAREPLTGEIVSRDVQIRANWAKIDKWKPGQPEEEPEQKQKEEKVEIDYRRINANRKYISKNLKKVTDKNRPKIQERYDELKAAGIGMTPKKMAELKAAGIKL